MTIVRLRDYPTDAELRDRLYRVPHEHTRFEDHKLRVAQTIQIGRWIGPHDSIADLSCGDSVIPTGVASFGTTLFLGDYAPGYEYQGPLETTLDMIPDVSLYICSETIEHVADPPAVLRKIRTKAHKLLLSTPVGETAPALGPGGNPEHVWGWNVEDVEQMLRDAGWDVEVLTWLQLRSYVYDFQIWACTRTPQLGVYGQ